MNTNSNSYVMMFAVAMCVVVSSVLAFLAASLKSKQEAAAEFDRQKNVMMAAGLIDSEDLGQARAELEKLYQDRVKEIIVDTRDGSVAEGKASADLKDLNEAVAAEDPANTRAFRSIATVNNEKGELIAIILPVSCKGLWSTLYGYLALEADKNQVRGIQFYKHKETPGLGGEVDNPQWTAGWKGKCILDDKGELVSITVKKGKVDASIEAEKKHYVDGLAGATITSKGVTEGVKRDLQAFSTYLNKEQ